MTYFIQFCVILFLLIYVSVFAAAASASYRLVSSFITAMLTDCLLLPAYYPFVYYVFVCNTVYRQSFLQLAAFYLLLVGYQ